jgi:hypothetical protein
MKSLAGRLEGTQPIGAQEEAVMVDRVVDASASTTRS